MNDDGDTGGDEASEHVQHHIVNINNGENKEGDVYFKTRNFNLNI